MRLSNWIHLNFMNTFLFNKERKLGFLPPQLQTVKQWSFLYRCSQSESKCGGEHCPLLLKACHHPAVWSSLLPYVDRCAEGSAGWAQWHGRDLCSDGWVTLSVFVICFQDWSAVCVCRQPEPELTGEEHKTSGEQQHEGPPHVRQRHTSGETALRRMWTNDLSLPKSAHVQSKQGDYFQYIVSQYIKN